MIKYINKTNRGGLLVLNSMTGYGNATVNFDGREVTLELKSVNHRFLDINIRMPRVLMFAEEELRKAIGKYIARGHVEVNLTYRNTREDSKIISIDKALVLQYKNAFNELNELGFENNIRVSDVARLPDVLTITQCDDDNEAVLKLIMEALGGGGHQTMAAAQLAGCDRETATTRLFAAVDEYFSAQTTEEKE